MDSRAGVSPLSQWIGLLRQIQQAGKSIQVLPLNNCSLKELFSEVRTLCEELDPTRLFIVAKVDQIGTADALISHVREVCASKRKHLTVPVPSGIT